MNAGKIQAGLTRLYEEMSRRELDECCGTMTEFARASCMVCGRAVEGDADTLSEAWLKMELFWCDGSRELVGCGG